MSRVILIEDNTRLAAMLAKSLSKVGIEVDVFGDLAAAGTALKLCDYSVMILDRGLPDGDGLTLLRSMARKSARIPCIVLTARDALHDRIEGFDSGADDYLSKPFAIEEFIARVRALMRRPHQLQEQALEIDGLCLRPEDATLLYAGKMVTLPSAEIQILLSLMATAGIAVERSKLEQAAWGLGKPVTPGALDVAIHRLRRKLEQIKANRQIMNIRGKGYALEKISP